MNMKRKTPVTADVATGLHWHAPECSGSRCLLMIWAGRAAGYEENTASRLEKGSAAQEEEGVAPVQFPG